MTFSAIGGENPKLPGDTSEGPVELTAWRTFLPVQCVD